MMKEQLLWALKTKDLTLRGEVPLSDFQIEAFKKDIVLTESDMDYFLKTYVSSEKKVAFKEAIKAIQLRLDQSESSNELRWYLKTNPANKELN